jgi:hypothetical protein
MGMIHSASTLKDAGSRKLASGNKKALPKQGF